ncbi:hypothetical protein KY495_11650 [Massilia sp. PAMC28688]|uniref:hypothetical protein n=1 Tax=Massilia sp. PAMC28688 TaxID=2861283 RepID=UPI001C6313F2|nr:hypothetical protein [Massilia sp. PAMC28688]QYF95744.1 hypothetical protein KY495_11650 [Massilia sp. PAMC28688]
MLRIFAGLSLWLMCALGGAASAPAGPAAAALTITFAEPGGRLVRGTSVYGAGRGVALHASDMVATGSGSMQLDVAGRPVAVGPGSRFFVKHGAELILLEGWMKVADGGKQPLTVSSANVELAGLAATVTLRVAAGSSELFAESADVMVNETQAGKLQRRTRLPREHFASRSGAKPLQIVPRPPAAFLSAMPPVFKETLVPLSLKGAPVPPARQGAAAYADLAPWLAAHPVLRQQFQRRFAPPRQARPASPSILTDQF